MRLVTYRATVEKEGRLGAIVDDLIIDVAILGERGGVSLPSRMLDFIDLGPVAVRELKALLDAAERRWPVDGAVPLVNAKLLAPIRVRAKTSSASGSTISITSPNPPPRSIRLPISPSSR